MSFDIRAIFALTLCKQDDLEGWEEDLEAVLFDIGAMGEHLLLQVLLVLCCASPPEAEYTHDSSDGRRNHECTRRGYPHRACLEREARHAEQLRLGWRELACLEHWVDRDARHAHIAPALS